MRKLFLFCTLVAAAIESPAQTDLIARIHFAGAERISADTNSAAFTNEFCSAEARALESQTLDKLSRAPFAWFKSKIPAGAGDGAAQLRPLLNDLLKSEWIFEIRDATNSSPEFALAIRLDSERAQLWSKNLEAVLQNWTGIGIAQDKSGNWELKKHEPPNLFRFQQTGGWVVIDCGENQLQLDSDILSPLLKTRVAVAETNWLAADLNWPRLAQLFPALAKFDFPKIQMQVAGRDKKLRMNGSLLLSQPLPPLKQWRPPENIVHQPFDSFTAVRGIAPWLQKQDWAQPFLIQPPPEQIFIWALPQIPFQTFAAAPVPDANAALAQLGRDLSAHTNWQTRITMPLKIVMTNREITIGGVPFISSFVRAVHGPAGDFLFAGFFPNLPKSPPLPPELTAHFNQPKLVCYHWEITAQRLKDLPQLSQLLLMVTGHEQLGGKSAAEKWLNQICPALGPTVTEITETAPNELAFTRTGSGGLTAVEFLALASWLEAKNFPDCDLRLPVRTRLRPNRPLPQTPGAPAPAPATSKK